MYTLFCKVIVLLTVLGNVQGYNALKSSLRCMLPSSDSVATPAVSIDKKGFVVAAALSIMAGWSVPSSLAGEENMVMAPKVEFQAAPGGVVRVGNMLETKADLKAISRRAVKTKDRWNKMLVDVQAYTDEGKQDEAKSVISSEMSVIKVNLRELSKVASQGDAVIREKDGKASFDYALGSFNLKPMAKQAELITQKINDIYFGSINQGSAAVQKDIAAASTLFNEWDGMVEQAIAALITP